MLSKESVVALLAKMPNEFTLDELVEKLILLEKIEEGIKDSASGNINTHEAMKKEVNSWFN